MTIVEKNGEKVYISKDNKEFDNKFFCLNHEDNLKFEEMKLNYFLMTNGKQSYIFKINNKDDFDFLVDYLEGIGNYNTGNHLYEESVKYYYVNLFERNADFEIKPLKELIIKTEQEIKEKNRLVDDLFQITKG